MADRKISDLTALTAPAAGDYLPIVDISEASAANKNKRITIEELLRGAPDGTAAAPGFAFESDGGNGMYLAGTDTVAISTNGTGRLFVDASGNVGIGASSSTGKFNINVSASASLQRALYATNSTDADFQIQISTGYTLLSTTTATPLAFGNGNTERARIDSSGRLLVGTSSSLTGNSAFQVATGGDENIGTYVGRDDGYGPALVFRKSRGSNASPTITSSGDEAGRISFNAHAGASGFLGVAEIKAEVDGTPGANDMPGRLVFSTTADGASSPTERMRINNSGYSKFTNANAYVEGGGFSYHEFYRSGSGLGLVITAADASYASIVTYIQSSRAATSAYSLLSAYSDNGGDREFNLQGDGNGYCDGAWTGGGADYAEYFEWSDGNPDEEDRRGIAVVLDGDKIRPAAAGEDPIGVISGNPSVVGDAAWNKWSGKYLRDDYGTYIQEDYEVTDKDGNTVIQQRRKLNPAYDPDQEYTSREERPEWDCVGLMGKLRIRKSQPTGSRWIKMRDISDSVEEWLVR
jgi:hypothetical protein